MSFIWPSMLISLVVLPLFVLFYLRLQQRRKLITERYGTLGIVREAAGRPLGRRRHIPPLLFLVGLTSLLLALARPQATVVTHATRRARVPETGIQRGQTCRERAAERRPRGSGSIAGELLAIAPPRATRHAWFGPPTPASAASSRGRPRPTRRRRCCRRDRSTRRAAG